MAVDSNALKNRANGFMAGFSPGQRVVVVVAIVALIGGGVFFASWASRPSMTPLFSNLSSSDASAITTKLASNKTPYQLADGGSTILVPQAQVYQTRLDMAGQNLPTGGSQGYSLLDKQGITTSDFIEHVDYQRALEGELSKTIGSIQGVDAATVHLVIPQQDVFSADGSKPSASVLVKTASGKTLTSGQVQSVVNLVASSVEGLDPAQVTLADDKGRMLAAPGQAAGGATQDQDRQSQTSSAEDDLSQKIQGMLTPLVGSGKAVVQARVQLNFDESQTTSETFNPNNKPSIPTSDQNSTETFQGQNPNSTGVLGTSGTGSTTGGQNGNYSKTDHSADYSVDRSVTQLKKASPSIDRVSVAVLLDSNVPNIDPVQITKLVNDAAGLQTSRGDTVTVSRMPFDKTQADAASKELSSSAKAAKSEQTMSLIKTVVTFVLVLIVLGVLFFLTRKRASQYSGSMPISLAELDAAMPALPSPDDMLNVLDTAPSRSADLNTPEALERAKIDRDIGELIERQPEEVASLLRGWLADRRS